MTKTKKKKISASKQHVHARPSKCKSQIKRPDMKDSSRKVNAHLRISMPKKGWQIFSAKHTKFPSYQRVISNEWSHSQL